MRIRITSHLGHHEAVIDQDVAKAIFDKMTGKTKAALPKSIRTKVPDNFEQLAALWTDSKMSYVASAKQGEQLVAVKEFDPQIEDMLFIAPVMGG